MTNAKHTPGPWAFCNETLCQAHGNYKHLGKYTEAPGLKGEAEANKSLIAATPDLLAALERILYAHDNLGNGAAMGEAILCEQYAHMARAAIAKAKGE